MIFCVQKSCRRSPLFRSLSVPWFMLLPTQVKLCVPVLEFGRIVSFRFLISTSDLLWYAQVISMILGRWKLNPQLWWHSFDHSSRLIQPISRLWLRLRNPKTLELPQFFLWKMRLLCSINYWVQEIFTLSLWIIPLITVLVVGNSPFRTIRSRCHRRIWSEFRSWHHHQTSEGTQMWTVVSIEPLPKNEMAQDDG